MGLLRKRGNKHPKPPSGVVARAGGKIPLGVRPACGIISVTAEIPGAECPYTFDDERLPAYILQQSGKFSSSQVIGGNVSARLSISTTCELSNEQIVAESAEIRWGQRYPPRSVQPITMLET